MFCLLDSTGCQLDSQIVEEIVDSLWSLGHLVFDSERGMVRISEKSSSFVAENDGFFEEGNVLVTL